MKRNTNLRHFASLRNVLGLSALFAASLAAPAAANAQDDFFKLIQRGDYKGLGAKLKSNIDMSRCDPALKSYMEANLDYLARGAKPKTPGSEIVIFRGVRNDKPYKSLPESGGKEFLLPNVIRYQRTAWDPRLGRINAYFELATKDMGGNGKKLFELSKIIEHHKGGGLGTSANSVKSVLISASTRPLPTFGPPFYIIKIAPERCIFNYKGLSGEYEICVPFWILPNEIVQRCETMEEVQAHPLYKQAKMREMAMMDPEYGSGTVNNWAMIEANIRAGRDPLTGVAGLGVNLGWSGAGADATPADVSKFATAVAATGATLERVKTDDPRLGESPARAYVDGQGKLHVLIPADGQPNVTVKKNALVEALSFATQVSAALKAPNGAAAVKTALEGAVLTPNDVNARKQALTWRLAAKNALLASLPANDPSRSDVTSAIEDLKRRIAEKPSPTPGIIGGLPGTGGGPAITPLPPH